MKKRSKGFSLIELLVVISIIAILSTVVMAGLNRARMKGRDARRIEDMKSIQHALELFVDTCGLGFPNNTSEMSPITAAGWGDDSVSGANCNGTVDMDAYLVITPSNPLPGGTPYTYCSASLANARAATFAARTCGGSRSDYIMSFTLEDASGTLPFGGHVMTPAGFK